MHKILGVFLLKNELIIMDDFSNDAKNRILNSATLTIGPNTYSSNSSSNAGYLIHNYTHYYVPNNQSIPGGSQTIRIAFSFIINTNDLSNTTATLNIFGEDVIVSLDNIQTITSVDGIYAVESNPKQAQMIDSTCQMLNECNDTLELALGLGNGIYVTGSDFSYLNKRLKMFFNESAQGGMSIHGEGGNKPEQILNISLMSFDLAAVKAQYPELGAKLGEYTQMLRELNSIIDVPGNTDRAKKLVSDLCLKYASFQYLFNDIFHR